MTHVDAFRLSVNPLSPLPMLARLHRLARPAGQGLLLAVLMLLLAGTAQAAGSSMPWEGPLQSILESIQGPVARIVAVIIIIATGLYSLHRERKVRQTSPVSARQDDPDPA